VGGKIVRQVSFLRLSRPKTLDEVAYQEEIVKALKQSIETKNVSSLFLINQLPHLLFYGPPGTGKTSTILAIGRQIYGYGNHCNQFFQTRIQ